MTARSSWLFCWIVRMTGTASQDQEPIGAVLGRPKSSVLGSRPKAWQSLIGCACQLVVKPKNDLARYGGLFLRKYSRQRSTVSRRNTSNEISAAWAECNLKSNSLKARPATARSGDKGLRECWY